MTTQLFPMPLNYQLPSPSALNGGATPSSKLTLWLDHANESHVQFEQYNGITQQCADDLSQCRHDGLFVTHARRNELRGYVKTMRLQTRVGSPPDLVVQLTHDIVDLLKKEADSKGRLPLFEVEIELSPTDAGVQDGI